MPNARTWQTRKRKLSKSIAALLGLKRLPAGFRVRMEHFREEQDPVVATCERLWPEIEKRRVPPERRKGDSFAAKRVTFPGVPGEPDVVGVLRIPKKLRKPVTAVLCLHGHARGLILGKEITECYAVPMAEAGFITFAHDAIRFGERRRREYDDAEVGSGGQSLFLGEKVFGFNALLQGGALLGANLAEFMRCVDFLERLPGVARVAAMGHSMGGIHSFWLAAMDKRVHEAVCLAGLLSYGAMVERDVSRYHGIFTIVPGLLTLCDTPEIVSLIAPRAFHAVHAEKDLGFPIDKVKEIVSHAARTYELYGAQGNLISKIVPGDHGDVLAEDILREVMDRL